jgi:3-oxoacyl-[acyl-carrier protein] reductase
VSARIALVTGGTRGIGLGVARALARDGWTLALCGLRSREEVADVVSELASLGGGAEYWPADIGSPNDRAQLLSSTVAHFGTLHALVNNAGRAPRVRADLLAATEDSFEEVMRTNLQGPYFLTQAVARMLVQQQPRESGPERAIVFVTSVSAEMASPHRGEAVCRTPRTRSHSGVRGAPGRHRNRHDRRREGDVRQAHRRRAGARRTMGAA